LLEWCQLRRTAALCAKAAYRDSMIGDNCRQRWRSVVVRVTLVPLLTIVAAGQQCLTLLAESSVVVEHAQGHCSKLSRSPSAATLKFMPRHMFRPNLLKRTGACLPHTTRPLALTC